MDRFHRQFLSGRILLIILFSSLVFICFGQKVGSPVQPILTPSNSLGRMVACDDCSSATCTAGAITDQMTAYNYAANNTQGCNPSEIRTVTAGDTVTFCATITTPAVLEENFISFYGSYLAANSGCGASNIIDWRLTENCVPVSSSAFSTTPPHLPSAMTRPIWEVQPNTTYEMCYDVVVEGYCIEVSTPCFAPHWVKAPCFLFVGTANQDCSRNDGTFDVNISYSNGGQGAGTYVLTNNGLGTLTGDDPNTNPSGTITVSNIPDGSAYDLQIYGNGVSSGCRFDITSPSYTCSFCPKITSATVEQDNCEGNTATLQATVDTGTEGTDYYISWLKNGTPINMAGSSTVGPDGEYGTVDDPYSALTYVHTLDFEGTPGACSFEDQVFTAELVCKTSESLIQGNKNTASTSNSVIANYNAENSTCLGLDLTNLPSTAIAESFEYQYRATTGSPFGNSWICEAILTLNTPTGSATPVCHPFWGGNCPSQPAGPTGSNNTTCFGGPGNGAGTLLNPTVNPAVVSYGGLNSTTLAQGNWQICVYDTYNDNGGSTEGVLNYVYFKVNYFLPPGKGVNFASSSIVDAVNISSPIILPTSPVSTASHPQGSGLVTGLRVCSDPIQGTDFTLPNASACEKEINLVCSDGIARYSDDNGATYTRTSPPGPYSNNQDVYYQVTTDGCPSNCGVTGTYTLLNCTNPPIMATPSNITVPEDSMTTICTPYLDADSGDTHSASICEDAQNGTAASVSIVGNEVCVTYTPDANFNGQDTFCLSICDQTNQCDKVDVVITVTPVNDAPIAADDATITDEDTAVTIDVQDNDSDIDNSTFTTVILSTSKGISSVLNGDSISYTPPLDFVGNDTITYQICDGGTPDLCDTAIVVITVNAINDTPVLDPIGTVTLPEDSMITVCSNFTDPDMGDTFTPSICENAQNGNAIIAIVGGQVCVTYTTTADYFGADSVCISVCDQTGACDSTTVVFDVTPVNDTPIAVDNAASTGEDTAVTIDVQDNDSDVDNATFTTTILGTSTQGISPTILNGDSISYTPLMDFVGNDTITYQICDGDTPDLCDTAIVVITVTAINDTPTLDPIGTVTLPEDSMITVCSNFVDPDLGDTFTPSICKNVQNGNATVSIVSGQLCVTYTPTADNFGADSVCISVCDQTGACDSTTVIYNVTPVNDAPIAVDDAASTNEDTQVTINAQENDSDIDNATFTTTILGISTEGISPTVLTNDSISYTPPMDFVGNDTITYQICDGGTPDLCDTAIVVITVYAINDTPVLDPIGTVTLPEDSMITVCSNFTDPDLGDTFTPSVCENAQNGNATVAIVSGQLCVTYTPTADNFGADSACIMICDQTGACDSTTVIFDVTPVNDAPIAVDDAASANEDTEVTIDVQDNDTDVDNATFATTIIGTSTQGITPTVLGNDSISYTPPMDFVGNDTITYQICDGGAPDLCDTAIVVITVNAINDAPVLDPIGTVTLPEDSMITVCSNFTDPDSGDTFTPSVCENAQKGNATVAIVGGQVCVTYTPTADYFGADSVCISICDQTGACDSTTVVYNVTPVNDAPIAVDDAASTNEDTPLTIDVQDNDSDVDNATLTTTILSTTNGTTSLLNADSISYTPPIDFVGNDTITYQICDGGTPDLCDTAIVVFTVNAINDTPTLDQIGTVTLPEDSMITVCSNFADPDMGDTFTSSICENAQNGNATVAIVGGQVCVTYTPTADYFGADSVCISICDQDGACDSTTVIYEVTPVNDAPIAMDDAETTDEDTAVTIDVQDNDSDIDNTTLTTTILSTANGTASLLNADSISYTPPSDFVGTDTITCQICDGSTPDLCDTSIVVITVTAINDSPVLDPISTITLPEDSLITVCSNFADPDLGDTFTPSICENAQNGNATVAIVGGQLCVTYTPTADYFGADSVCISICDQDGACDSTMVIYEMTPVNDAPIALADSQTTDEDTAITIDLQDNDSDIDNTTLTTTILSTTTGAAVVVNADSISYTPPMDFVGNDTITYQICDGGTPDLCDTAIVVITVTAINDAPVLDPVGTVTLPEDSMITVCSNFTDPDAGDSFTPSVCENAQNGNARVAIVGGQLCVTYTPTADYFGADSVCISICDQDGACDSTTVIYDVTPVNDAPIAQDDATSTDEDTTVTIDVQDNDFDVDNATLTTTILSTANGTAVVANADSITYTPPTDFVGNDTITYRICDGGTPDLCDTAIAVITVNALNDTPTLDPIGTVTLPEDSMITVCSNFIDPDMGDTFTPSVCESAKNGNATVAIVSGQLCVTYTPTVDYFGADSVCISICDQAGACDSTTVIYNVTPVNDAPIAVDDAASTNEDTSLTIDVQDNDSDVDNSMFTTTILGTSTQGISPTVLANDSINYTPPMDFVGNDTITYKICDGGTPGLCDTAIVVVVVNGINDVPTLDSIGIITLPEDSMVTVCSNFTDPDIGDSFSASLCGAPDFGSASVSLVGNQTCLTYTPPANYHGLDTICIAICDQTGACDSLVLPIVVVPVNDVPFFTSIDSALVVEDTMGTVYFSTAMDIDTGQIFSYALAGGVDDANFSINTLTGEVSFMVLPDFEFPSDDNGDNLYEISLEVCDDGTPILCDTLAITIRVLDIYEDCDGDGIIDSLDDDDDGDGESDSTDPSPCDPSVFSSGVGVQVQLLLAGNYDDGLGLMWDSLRQANLLPMAQPYEGSSYSDLAFSGTESVNTLLYTTAGNDAIVDWVLLELRDSAAPTSVVARRAALLQRDGDVVHVDGTHSVTFPNISAGAYFVVARHRNHLGVMTATAQNLAPASTIVDFTLMATQAYQRADAVGHVYAREEQDDGKMALWAGNMYADNAPQRVIFQGNNADSDAAYFDVLLDSQNLEVSPIWIRPGYLRSDGNLDGKTIFQGGNADTDLSFFTVLLFPDNTFYSPIFVVFEQLP